VSVDYPPASDVEYHDAPNYEKAPLRLDARADRLGASREKLSLAPGRSGLLKEAETLVALNEIVAAGVQLKCTAQRDEESSPRHKTSHRVIGAHLPRVTVVYEIPESERQC